MNTDELRTLITKHSALRPDALVCLHPAATRGMRTLFTQWNDEHSRLKTLLIMAISTEANQWRDLSGQPITPLPWGGPNATN
jgi:hypothetical protein